MAIDAILVTITILIMWYLLTLKYSTKKYKLLRKNKHGLYRIKALKDVYGGIKKGDKGGLVSGYHNLSQKGNCWIYINARVISEARVDDNASILDNSTISGKSHIYGNAIIYGSSYVTGESHIYGNAIIYGSSYVTGESKICDFASVKDNAWIIDSTIKDNACVRGSARLHGYVKMYDDSWVGGDARVYGKVELRKNVRIYGQANLVKGSWDLTPPQIIIQPYIIQVSGPDLISIGCQTHTIEEWGKQWEGLAQAEKMKKTEVDMYKRYFAILKDWLKESQ